MGAALPKELAAQSYHYRQTVKQTIAAESTSAQDLQANQVDTTTGEVI